MKTTSSMFHGSRGGRWVALLALLSVARLGAVVEPPNQTPEVRLTIASEGPYVAPETLLLAARVGDADGWVNRVEFLANGEVIGSVSGDSRSMQPMNPFRFRWRGVLAGDYALQARAFDNAGGSTLSEPVKFRVEQAEQAFIVIRQPEPGALFKAPARVEINAVAVDPRADIRRVVFFANEERLGVSEFLSRIAIIPGNPIPHHFVWEDAPAGEYLLRALAEDVNGDLVRSEPTPITVEPAFSPNFVTIEAIKSEAEEGVDDEAGVLRFLVQREGDLEVAMPVYFELGGSATPGEDYADLPDVIEIPAGEPSTELVVRSLPDNTLEGEETVVVTILPPACPEIYPPPPFCYEVGRPGKARGVIVDEGPPPPSDGIVLVPAGAEWSYWNEDAPPPEGWKGLDYPDADWLAGPAQLGYGDGDEATVTRDGGPPYPVTAYFRTRFDVPADLPIRDLRVRLVRDDGAAVYLNGVELLRSNLPDGPLDFETRAAGRTGRPENRWHRFTVPATALVAGRNVLAVEVHQHSPTSSDLSFDLALLAFDQEPPPDRPIVRIVATAPETTEPSPNTRVAPGRFEITRTGPVTGPLVVVCNFGGSATPKADYRLDPAPGPMSTFVIPAGQEGIEIFVGAVDDALPETDETVVAELGRLPGRLPFGAPEHGPGQLYTIDPEHARARVVIHDNDTAGAAELVIHHPPEGAVFPAGEPIPINILAVDPAGYLPRVVVFADEKRIGVSEIVFFRAPDPGEPIEHFVEWKNPPPGEHTLVAKAFIADGEAVVSEPVHIFVEPLHERVVLALGAPRKVTGEPSPTAEPAPAAFVVERVGGPLNVDVPVFLAVDGTAENGLDYREIPDQVLLPAGHEAVEIPVIALPDDLREGPETVIVRLLPPACIAIEPPPPSCYLISDRAVAKIVIQDADQTGNRPPKVAIVHPRHGAVLPLDEPVEVVAEATDSDGRVVRMRLLLNRDELAANDGDRLVAEWLPAAPGKYVLTAVAVDNAGAEGVSHPVTVFVREGGGLAFVRRELPAAYVPGEPLRVRLAVHPPDYGIAWAVEDTPPRGWTVGEVSDEGAFDPATGKVKFGPYVDRTPRTLVYQVTPPEEDAVGPRKFHGRASVDGESWRITGDQVIRPANDRHPADRTPADMALTMTEVTAYTAAWKSGAEWPAGPVPIPLSYVTRAGALWKGGEVYIYEPGLGGPPACWVNPPLPGPLGPGLAGAHPDAGDAERELPAVGRPGAALAARVTIRPPAGTAAWAVEETVPSGWRVAAISHEGQFDPVTRCIRWGLFFGDAPVKLRYQAIAPNGVTSIGRFHGRVSFDGAMHELGGGHEAIAHDATTAVRFTRVEHRNREGVRLHIQGGAGQLIVVETSSDLRHWREVAPVGLVDGELVFDDADADAAGPRFYRARPIGP